MEKENQTNDTNQENKPFELDINPHEAYSLVNKVYEKNISEVDQKINDYFAAFLKNKSLIIQDAKEFIKDRYKETIINVEGSLAKLENDLANVNTNDQIEVKRLKRKLDDTMKLIECEKSIDQQFNEVFAKLDRKLGLLKLKDMLNPNLKFSISGHYGQLGWDEGDDPLLIVKPGGTSYKCCVSTMTFENELTCKVRIISIDEGLISAYWNYTFGLIRAGKEKSNQTSYYTDSVLLQSNGHLNTQFSGTSNTTTSLTASWTRDCVLTVCRDTNNDVYFSVNDGERKKGFTNITGEMKVVLGFSSGLSGDTFEMLEIGAYSS
jgi:hypothetical protein